MSVARSKQLLDRLSAAEAARLPEERLMDALAHLIDIPLREVPGVLKVSPEEAHQAVSALRKHGQVTVLQTPDGVKSVRRAVEG